MDAESCNASGMYVDEYMLNAGKMSLISGARSVWGWPITWPFERRHLVKKAARLVDEMPLEDLWFSGDRRPAYAKRFFRAEASGAAQLAFLRNHLDGGAAETALRRKLERTAAYWADRKHDGPAFARAVEATRRLIRDLDEDLVKFKVGKKSGDGGDAGAPQGVGEWLGGDKLSVGDCYWHVAAARLVGLGLGHMLDRYPRQRRPFLDFGSGGLTSAPGEGPTPVGDAAGAPAERPAVCDDPDRAVASNQCANVHAVDARKKNATAPKPPGRGGQREPRAGGGVVLLGKAP
ncbi:hypothetical protein JL722_15094 [Aureococcus anophagefferens]|nr:hypothetical protein JL722_15094 [Aureococcus anophagefferens]